jgi:hypothetical protein
MEIFLNIHYYCSQYFLFFDLEDVIFENFNIFENNIISVALAKERTMVYNIWKQFRWILGVLTMVPVWVLVHPRRV